MHRSPPFSFLVRVASLAASVLFFLSIPAFAQPTGTYVEQTGTSNPFDGITALSSASALDAITGDFDSDGDADLLAFDGSTERYFRNDGAGQFTEQTGATNPFDGISSAFGARATTFVGDIDGDGDVDIVDYQPASGTFGYVENTSGSAYTRQSGTSNPFDGIQVAGNQTTVDAVFGDFDTDGDIDLLAFDGTTERYYQNDGSGGFTEQTGAANPFDSVSQSFWTKATSLVRDFDGDGDLDIAARDGSAPATAQWMYVENTDGSSYADRSGGAFPLDNVVVEATRNSAAIVTGDFNLDGSLDLLAFDGTTEIFYAGDGAGTYTPESGVSNPFEGVSQAVQVFANTMSVNVNPFVDDDIDVVFGDDNVLRFIERTGNGVIPVELAGFHGRLDNDTVHLSWETLSETNNAGFDVQRRISTTDGDNSGPWTTLYRAEGAGTTTNLQTYQFTDNDLPFEATGLTYRLRQVDLDGTVRLSEEVYLQRIGVEALTFHSVYPNPAQGSAVAEFGTTRGQRVTLSLFDIMGRRVRTLFDSDVDGRESVIVQTDGLASGMYFIRLQAGGETRTQRFVVVR